MSLRALIKRLLLACSRDGEDEASLMTWCGMKKNRSSRKDRFVIIFCILDDDDFWQRDERNHKK